MGKSIKEYNPTFYKDEMSANYNVGHLYSLLIDFDLDKMFSHCIKAGLIPPHTL